jgi:hypothetical protein
MNHIDILLPFALPPPELSSDLFKVLHCPAFSSLLSRTRSGAGVARSESFDSFARTLPHEAWLARKFQLDNGAHRNSSPPVAKLLMQALGLTAGDGTWFVLQPVHLHIARDHLVLTDPRRLALSDSEARQLFAIAQPIFEEAGKTLMYGNAAIWFLRADDWADLDTATPDAATGHNIDLWMPKGPNERNWRKVQNDVQMHWFGHALNDDREARGDKPVNSLWLWGAAVAAERVPSRYQCAFNLRGWTAAFGELVPIHREASMASALPLDEAGDMLVLLDDLLEPALSNDWASWLSVMHALEAQWFAPLLDALKSGRVAELTLMLSDDARLSRFSSSRTAQRKFWIKPTLSALQS